MLDVNCQDLATAAGEGAVNALYVATPWCSIAGAEALSRGSSSGISGTLLLDSFDTWNVSLS